MTTHDPTGAPVPESWRSIPVAWLGRGGRCGPDSLATLGGVGLTTLGGLLDYCDGFGDVTDFPGIDDAEARAIGLAVMGEIESWRRRRVRAIEREVERGLREADAKLARTSDDENGPRTAQDAPGSIPETLDGGFHVGSRQGPR